MAVTLAVTAILPRSACDRDREDQVGQVLRVSDTPAPLTGGQRNWL
jgi:hypothetical protein